jgi:hypothetical protein
MVSESAIPSIQNSLAKRFHSRNSFSKVYFKHQVNIFLLEFTGKISLYTIGGPAYELFQKGTWAKLIRICIDLDTGRYNCDYCDLFIWSSYW